MTNETEKPPIDAVRAKIAEMRVQAKHLRIEANRVEKLGKRPVAYRHESTLFTDAANALEAVLDALAYDSREHHADAPCTKACIEGLRQRLEAALTRAITKGEQ